jgi:hypothetical protein
MSMEQKCPHVTGVSIKCWGDEPAHVMTYTAVITKLLPHRHKSRRLNSLQYKYSYSETSLIRTTFFLCITTLTVRQDVVKTVKRGTQTKIRVSSFFKPAVK